MTFIFQESFPHDLQENKGLVNIWKFSLLNYINFV